MAAASATLEEAAASFAQPPMRSPDRKRATGVKVEGRKSYAETVLGSTAEWIVELPATSSESDPSFHPLPDYGKVVIDQCATEHALPPAAPTFLPRLIRMKQSFLQFNRVAVISTASRRHEPSTRVRMTYRRP
jgi:hypothetical protein